MGLTWATQTLDPRTGGWMLLGTFLVGGLAAWGAARLGEQAGDQRTALVIILAGAVGMRLALLFFEPYLSTDIYRYIWDGRVQAAGINPYRYVPRAPELAQLRDTAIFPQHQSRRLRRDHLPAGGAGDLLCGDAPRRKRHGHEARRCSRSRPAPSLRSWRCSSGKACR